MKQIAFNKERVISDYKRCRIVLRHLKKVPMFVITDFMCLQNFHNKNNILYPISRKIWKILNALQEEKEKLHINQKADIL